MKRIKLEHENKISKTAVPITGTKDEDRISIWYLLLLTLAPLYLLVIIGVIVLALIMLDRHFISLTNFMLQQIIFIAILIIAMVIAIVAYSLSVIHAHRKIGIWRQNGHKMQANVGLLVLAIVASMMIVPIILTLFFH
jgi:ABC-type multidrug transport system permease subunit